ncbi:8677_t:CDS:2 [Funneliformis geosporum]|uniref:8677_t:CDS:1 n=1 Tax=Funneliformis geosporum TaxID=1117311 RepID=A0A9W4X459_9GLOM|nr:8677_t:CDS:2 [Funneliformis geosporum]
MNVSRQLLETRIKSALSEVKAKSIGDDTQTKDFIKKEIFKSIKKAFGEENFKNGFYQGGLNKEEVLSYLEEVFGRKNLVNGKYKGGKEVTIEVINELFGKENIKNGKYQGDLSNLKGVLGEKNVVEEESNKENIKTIETKLGGTEKFQDGVYQVKPEVVKAVVEELEAKGIILKKVRNIFGEGKFYPDEANEKNPVPQGREGCYRSDEEIAMMQAQEQKKIRAIEEGKELVGGDFTDNEKNEIHLAKTPQDIEIVLKAIPGKRRKEA